jgi:dihydrofolate synthase / folylpolyglutamate synthase
VNYAEALAFLDSHINMETGVVHDGTLVPAIASGRKFDPPSLDRMRRLCAFLGDPQLDLSILHVTGTNGKGSTARMMASLLQAHGLSTGVYTSPHLHRANERIATQYGDISDVDFADMVRLLGIAEDAAGQRNSWFELVTAGAFRYFSDQAVEAAVMEVGAGGRWDATNVGDGQVAVVTNIDLDHQQWFGDTTRDIAREKSGIFKPGATAVIGETDPDLLNFLVKAANQAEVAATWTKGVDFACDSNRLALGGRVCTLRTPTTSYANIFVPMHGAHQGENAAVAIAAVEAFTDGPLSHDTVLKGFSAVTNPGRMEVASRDPLVLLDGAHNPAGARIAAATLDEEFAANTDRILVIGFLTGKDPGEMLDALQVRKASLVLAVAPPSLRALDPHLIVDAAQARGVSAKVALSAASAVDAAMAEATENALILVSGSLYLVAEARKFLRN